MDAFIAGYAKVRLHLVACEVDSNGLWLIDV